jgi:pimeloyl-ACP methyl ester carboxylesterase
MSEQNAPAGDPPLPAEDLRQTIEIGSGADARRIAVRITPGNGPALVWLGGFRSDMAGTKASRLADWGRAQGRQAVRFDYSGHGESAGDFEDGTIGAWLQESLAVIDTFGGPAPVLIGSSMGGWLALLAARRMAAAGTPPAALPRNRAPRSCATGAGCSPRPIRPTPIRSPAG